MSIPSERLGQYREKVLQTLTEPRSANEVAGIVGCNQHTAQSELMQLALEGKARHKKLGRTHVFWKSK